MRQNVGVALANSEAPLALESGCDMAEGGVSPGGFKFMMLIQEQARGGLSARNPELWCLWDGKERVPQTSRK